MITLKLIVIHGRLGIHYYNECIDVANLGQCTETLGSLDKAIDIKSDYADA
jgi:hypothetical protein